jgi:hypothetical protein
MRAQNGGIIHGQRFGPSEGEFGLAAQAFPGAADARGPFRMELAGIFDAAFVSYDFHQLPFFMPALKCSKIVDETMKKSSAFLAGFAALIMKGIVS